MNKQYTEEDKIGKDLLDKEKSSHVALPFTGKARDNVYTALRTEAKICREEFTGLSCDTPRGSH